MTAGGGEVVERVLTFPPQRHVLSTVLHEIPPTTESSSADQTVVIFALAITQARIVVFFLFTVDDGPWKRFVSRCGALNCINPPPRGRNNSYVSRTDRHRPLEFF